MNTKNFQSNNEKEPRKRLSLHTEDIHFCQGTKDRVRIDMQREFLERGNTEYFMYRNGYVRLFSNDKHGYRINEPNLKEVEKHVIEEKKEVWIFGDSFTQGALADNTESISSQLELFNDSDLKFKNFGAGGYGVLNSYQTYKWALEEYKQNPELIIFLAVYNDIEDDLRTAIRLDSYKKGLPDIFDGDGENSFVYLTRSRLRELGYDNIYFARKNILAISYSNYFNQLFPDFVNRRLYALAERLDRMLRGLSILFDGNRNNIALANRAEMNLRAFIDLAKRNKTEVSIYLLTSVSSWQNRMESAYSTMLDKVSREEGVNFKYIKHSDMQKYSPLLNKGPESLYGSPDTHPNEFGYFAFAKVIAEDLSRTYNMNFELNKYFVDRTSYVVGEENCPA